VGTRLAWSYLKGGKDVANTGEDRISIWSWWWHRLWQQSPKDSPDKVLMKQIGEGEKARMANLPRKGWASKRGRYLRLDLPYEYK
jgi:hypothetical protein